jgi:EmrB/QacA subfamily drug resistance transporter
VTGASVAVGPLVGGVLTDGIGWEAIFFVNVPVGIAAIALALRTVEESHAPSGARIDWPGLVTFSGGLFALIFGLIRGNTEGWGSTLIIACFAAAVVLGIAFVMIERRSASPMLDLSLFRKPAFVGASVAAFVLSASMFSMFLYLTLYIQNILGFTPLQSGLRFLPVTLLSFFVAPLAGKFAERVGIRWFLGAGLICVGVGELLMRGLAPGDEWTALLPGFILAGIGIGLVNPPLATAAVGVVEPQRAGMASGINSTFRQIGIATGIAALGAIFQHVVAQSLVAGAHGRLPKGVTGSQAADFVSFGGFRQLHNAALNRLAEQSFVDGLNRILLIAALVALVGAVLSMVLTRPSDFVAHGAPGPAAEPEVIAA